MGISARKAGGGKYVPDDIRFQIRLSPDIETLRARLDEICSGGFYVTYGLAQANEIVSKGLALFAFHRGSPREAIVSAVNLGRDTDCLAAVAGGLCGALAGTGELPREWIDQVDAATRQDPYTNNRRTIGETADGLYEAFLARQARLAAHLEEMRSATEVGAGAGKE